MSLLYKGTSGLTSVEPVNDTLSTSMCSDMAAPAAGPYPGSILTVLPLWSLWMTLCPRPCAPIWRLQPWDHTLAVYWRSYLCGACKWHFVHVHVLRYSCSSRGTIPWQYVDGLTSVEPVNDTLSTSMCSDMAAPAVGPYPAAISEHMDVDKVSFTGSTEVRPSIYCQGMVPRLVAVYWRRQVEIPPVI